MPRKCCVPSCRGIILPKIVSTFRFPQDESVKTVMKAIHRDNFTPSDNSVVCEVHFQSQDVERSSSVYDPKSGKLITSPLDRPRLRKGAVPSLLPGCPAYLSTPNSSRENPENRRQRLENAFLRSALKESVTSLKEHMK